jgi:hypothetical protein
MDKLIVKLGLLQLVSEHLVAVSGIEILMWFWKNVAGWLIHGKLQGLLCPLCKEESMTHFLGMKPKGIH